MTKSKPDTGPTAKRRNAKLTTKSPDDVPVTISDVLRRSLAHERGLAATNEAQRTMLSNVSPQFIDSSPFLIHAGVLTSR